MTPRHKYARIERERRFLLRGLPQGQRIVRVRRITDRYIEATNLRLRDLNEEGRPAVFKLTQKIPAPDGAAQQGYITTIYLDREAHQRFTQLPARVLTKVRYSVPPFGIDVFEGALNGLVLAEAEFESVADAAALTIPDFVVHEVTSDARFTGGSLAYASRLDLERWLAAYGIGLEGVAERPLAR
jgi:CYTH domain-containing protein